MTKKINKTSRVQATRKDKLLIAFMMVMAVLFGAIGILIISQPQASRAQDVANQQIILDSLISEINQSQRQATDELAPLSMPSEYLPGALGHLHDARVEIIHLTQQDIELGVFGAATMGNEVALDSLPLGVEATGVLLIDKIDMKIPVLVGVEYDTLRIAPGWVTQTAKIGNIGNAVIAGHRNYSHGEMFNRLGEVEVGDILGFHAVTGEYMEFVVFELAVIDPYDQIAFIQPPNNSIITLFTCTPMGTSDFRLLVRAVRVI